MKQFIDKLIERLEEEYLQAEKYMELSDTCDEASRCGGRAAAYEKAQKIVKQLAEEHNNGCCEWEYDDFEDGWQTSCGTTFSLCDSDKEITHYCPCCGKKIKVVE